MHHFSNFEYKQKTQAFGLGFEYLNDKEINLYPANTYIHNQMTVFPSLDSY